MQIARSCMKKISTSLDIRKIQIKSTLRFFSHLSEWLSSENKTTNDGEDAGNNEHLYSVNGNIN
jgi:hypothetical protein